MFFFRSYSDLAAEINHGGNVELTRDYYIGGGDTIVISVANSVIDGKGAVIDLNGTNT